MDAIREQLRKPLVVGIVGFIIGLIIGLPVLGWGLWPVQWTDASPQQLRADLQEDYMRMAIDSYALTGDAAKAQQRYAELGDQADEVLAAVQTSPGTLSPEAIVGFSTVINQGVAGTPAAILPTSETPGAAPVEGTPAAETPTEGTPAAGTTEETEGRGVLGWLLPAMCIITLLLAAAFVVVMIRRGSLRLPGSGPAPISEAAASREALMTDYSTEGEEPPIGQFMATYKLGDDLFDDSFSIDSPSGEFLGECGVGISETIGVGDPKKVTAFEVWLFDKNDIQTVTKVLMSTHAFLDETVRQRLAAKGEPVEAQLGTQVVLETASLQLVARVVDMTYGEGALPERSFFDQAILELAVWQK